ncbi:putative secreted protein (Por secretion system target) [Larkinella arboricola]|uniref:Putative secreted protein (Por secretion system target) n=1 Tax=Larkinella arboricola TaxID=643671 RepID=A0A327X4J2_LARAB|nr:putative secreted protein (Por secretion system target) [Larkinella arboricola]
MRRKCLPFFSQTVAFLLSFFCCVCFSHTKSWSAKATAERHAVLQSQPGPVLARINAGGSAVTTNGVAWSASQYFSGGKPYTNSKVTAIAGTDNDAIYLTEYSAGTNLAGFTFAMPVPTSGQYTVKLHFAEIYWGATGGKAGGPGQRVFSANLEGGPVELANYDILAEVGSMTAVVKTFTVGVSDGTLNIDFSASANQPKISAIEVFAPATTANTPPVLATIGNKTVNEGSVLNVPLSATDADGDAVTITATNLPSFASLNNNVLTFSPGFQAAGSYTITVRATDSKQASDQKTFTLVVNDVPTTGVTITHFTLINAATDQEIRTLANNEVINLATLPTSNLNIRANTSPSLIGSVKMVLSGQQSRTQTETGAPYALFGDSNGNYNNWTPTLGSYTLKGTPYTGSGATGTAGPVLTINFSVVNQPVGNQPPTLATPIPDQSTSVGTAFSFSFGASTFTDANGDALSYSATLDNNTALPGWLTFTSATRTFSGTPPAGSPASIAVKVTASDGKGGTASDSFIITIGTSTGIGTWQTIAPTSGQPTARQEGAYVQAGDRFYLMGGRGIKPVQVYDPVNRTWVNAAATPINLHHFQAVTLDGLIYAIGAMTGNYPAEPSVPQIYIYDPRANKWLVGPEIPVARLRGSVGLALYNNKFYLVGGNTKGHSGGYVNWFDEYDPATNTWKVLPNAPHARDHFQAAVVGTKLYAAGGRRSSYNTGQTFTLTVPEVDVYDFTTGQWSTLSNPIPTQRGGTTTVVLDNEVIVIGGESSQPTAHKETEALNVTTGVWRRLADLQQGRHATQAIVNNGSIYITAGSGAQGGSPVLSSQEVFYKSAPTTPTGVPVAQSQLTAPASAALGQVQINTTKNAVVTVSNSSGNQAILLSSIAVSGSTEFTVQSPYTLPFVVPPGKNAAITVKFKPLSSGSKTATLTIQHSGAGGSTAVALNGSGVATAVSASALSAPDSRDPSLRFDALNPDDIFEKGERPIRYYPNPFSHSLTIQTEEQGAVPVALYDSYGRSVMPLADVQSGQAINLGSELEAGVYILQVGTGPKAKRYKLVKVR